MEGYISIIYRIACGVSFRRPIHLLGRWPFAPQRIHFCCRERQRLQDATKNQSTYTNSESPSTVFGSRSGVGSPSTPPPPLPPSAPVPLLIFLTTMEFHIWKWFWLLWEAHGFFWPQSALTEPPLGLSQQICVHFGSQEPGVRVFLHEAVHFPLGLIKARRRGLLHISSCHLPCLEVYVHLGKMSKKEVDIEQAWTYVVKMVFVTDIIVMIKNMSWRGRGRVVIYYIPIFMLRQLKIGT